MPHHHQAAPCKQRPAERIGVYIRLLAQTGQVLLLSPTRNGFRRPADQPAPGVTLSARRGAAHQRIGVARVVVATAVVVDIVEVRRIAQVRRPKPPVTGQPTDNMQNLTCNCLTAAPYNVRDHFSEPHGQG